MTLPRVLRTERLVLRATEAEDWRRAVEIQSDWNVTRNLRMAAFPPDAEETRAWFASHAEEWRNGTAYRFAIVFDGRPIGVTDIDGIGAGEGSLGYWLEEPAWGKGYASEAARGLVAFAFTQVGLTALRSGHVVDNEASGRVLTRLGFVSLGEGTTWSRSRRSEIRHRRYRLER